VYCVIDPGLYIGVGSEVVRRLAVYPSYLYTFARMYAAPGRSTSDDAHTLKSQIPAGITVIPGTSTAVKKPPT
jgi:hypothetical protein